MNSSKRNVHNSGPLGMLMQKGQIKKVNTDVSEPKQHIPGTASHFEMQSGVTFKENELIIVNPLSCEPWEYANRQDEELEDLDGLIQSIKTNEQLQPIVIMDHPSPHGDIKYQIIFGRKRHLACLQLKRPLIAIKKKFSDLRDAIAIQYAENEHRNNVSPYSNSLLYKKLLKDKVFNSQKELAKKLGISDASMVAIMSFTKIPKMILSNIPKIHKLSIIMSLTINKLLNESSINLKKLEEVAPQIGIKITSPSALIRAVAKPSESNTTTHKPQQFTDNNGNTLFSLRHSNKGVPSLVIHSSLAQKIDIEKLCLVFKESMEKVV